jgi:hypothetical protein
MRSFAEAGTPLYDVYGGASKQRGLAILMPNTDRVVIEVVVLVTEASARRSLPAT